ncbi:hypothetical protein [Actinacidiphila glaucinigra]
MNRPLRAPGLVAAYSEGHAAAGRLHDAGLDHPQVTRFVTRYFLERGDGREVRPFVAASVADKVAAVQDAQRRGTVTCGSARGRTSDPWSPHRSAGGSSWSRSGSSPPL